MSAQLLLDAKSTAQRLPICSTFSSRVAVVDPNSKERILVVDAGVDDWFERRASTAASATTAPAAAAIK